MIQRAREGASFFLRFCQRPGSVGAVWPSSPGLARMMVAASRAGTARSLAEIGPGTGAFTGPLLAAMADPAKYLAVEIDPEMCEAFRRRFPKAPLAEGDAAELPRLLRDRGLGPVDAVVSGLPWAAFPPDLQNRVMDGVWRALRPGGRFATFAYLQGMALPAGRRFRELLGRKFERVTTTPVVWANLPPAAVYVCRKGRPDREGRNPDAERQ